MNINEIFKNKHKFVVREIANELILVPLTGKVAKMNEMFTMNETGKFIWENIQENTTLETLVAKITEEFNIDQETARHDTEIFINRVISVLLKQN